MTSYSSSKCDDVQFVHDDQDDLDPLYSNLHYLVIFKTSVYLDLRCIYWQWYCNEGGMTVSFLCTDKSMTSPSGSASREKIDKIVKNRN